MTVSLIGFHPELVNLIQQNALERYFNDALYPRLLYRADVSAEVFKGNLGEVKIFTRTGDMAAEQQPLTPGYDPVARSYSTEQWRVEPAQWGSRIQTHMPSSYVEIASKFAQDTQKLGEGAGRTLNNRARNTLFTAYLSGDTMSTAQANSGQPYVRVASLNGFRDRILNGTMVAVSSAAPIAAEVSATNIQVNVIAAIPDDPNYPNGPGTLQLSANLAANLLIRNRVRTLQRARILRAGGAATVDALTAGSLLTQNDLITAIQTLRAQNVPPHSDGYYHCHIPSNSVGQLFQDNAWQRQFQSIPENAMYRNVMVGVNYATIFYDNTEAPNSLNTGVQFTTGTNARESPDIGGEVINENGVPIARAVITGGDVQKEHYIPEDQYITEAGVNGKIGNFTVTNNGVTVMTERIRYIVRAPQDVLQQIVDQAWSWTGDYAIPTDVLTGNGARFKRAVVIEHAGLV